MQNELINKLPLPDEIIRKINSYLSYYKCKDCYKLFPSSTCKKCNSCNDWLCNIHSKRALIWGKYYRNYYRICSQCCWGEITLPILMI